MSELEQPVTQINKDGAKVLPMTPIKGYTPINLDKQRQINLNKEMEERLLRVLDALGSNPHINLRWISVARTHFEEGFMAMNRAIFNPTRIKLPEDDQVS